MARGESKEATGAGGKGQGARRAARKGTLSRLRDTLLRNQAVAPLRCWRGSLPPAHGTPAQPLPLPPAHSTPAQPLFWGQQDCAQPCSEGPGVPGSDQGRWAYLVHGFQPGPSISPAQVAAFDPIKLALSGRGLSAERTGLGNPHRGPSTHLLLRALSTPARERACSQGGRLRTLLWFSALHFRPLSGPPASQVRNLFVCATESQNSLCLLCSICCSGTVEAGE